MEVKGAQTPRQDPVGKHLVSDDPYFDVPIDKAKASSTGPWLVTPAHHPIHAPAGTVGQDDGAFNRRNLLETVNCFVDAVAKLTVRDSLGHKRVVGVEDQDQPAVSLGGKQRHCV